MTVAVSNANCKRAVNRCAGGRAIIRFSTNLHFILRRYAGITNASTILRNSTLTLSAILVTNVASIQIFLSDELEHFFLIAFYLNIQRDI